MQIPFQLLFLAFLAGAAIPVGGLLARIEHIQPRWLEQELRHSIIAFGGGALLSAVALVLVPEGSRLVSIPVATLAFGGGGLAFFWIDRMLASSSGTGVQLMAMLLDFVPESMALGATFTSDVSSGKLIAFLIGLQNLPEAFNAYRELETAGKLSKRHILVAFSLLSLLGPLAAWIGLGILDGRPVALGGIMLFAAGGILYLIFQDIAPAALNGQQRAPALGAVAGFLLGLVGQMLTLG